MGRNKVKTKQKLKWTTQKMDIIKQKTHKK